LVMWGTQSRGGSDRKRTIKEIGLSERVLVQRGGQNAGV